MVGEGERPPDSSSVDRRSLRLALALLVVGVLVGAAGAGGGRAAGDPGRVAVASGPPSTGAVSVDPAPSSAVTSTGFDAVSTQRPVAFNISASLAVTASQGSAPFNATFTAHATGSSTATTLSFLWEFGDGSSSATENVTVTPGTTGLSSLQHVFTSAGTFNTSISVTDNVGDGSAVREVSVQVAPTLVAIVTVTPGIQDVGRPVVVNATAAGGWPPYHAAWTSVPSNCVAGTFNLTCVPASPGSYTVRLTIADAVGDHASALVNFSVNPRLTVQASFTSSYVCSGTTGVLVYDLSAVPSGGAPPYTVAWAFGDGTANGTGLSVSHDYGLNQSYTITVRVGDLAQAFASQTFSISTGFPTCAAQPPASYLPPTWVLATSVGIAAVVVVALATVYLRMPPPGPGSPRSLPRPRFPPRETPAPAGRPPSTVPPPDEGTGPEPVISGDSGE